MVFYYTSNVVEPPYMIYMGEDKYENEHLIKYAWPEDIWFHVSKLSSAHVYLRLPKNQSIEDIPQAVLEDCCQLVKANSIEGNKIGNVEIVYTPASNLKKSGDMDTGQVGFHKSKAVKHMKVEKRINEIVNRLNKTEVEKKNADLKGELDERDRQERDSKKQALKEMERKQKEQERINQAAKEARSYDRLMNEDKMTSNADGYDSDDFM